MARPNRRRETTSERDIGMTSKLDRIQENANKYIEKNCTTCKYATPCNLFEPVAMCMKQNDAVVSFPTGDNPSPCELWEINN